MTMSKSRESSLGSVAMEEEEDDLYGSGPTADAEGTAHQTTADLESGEEEESEDESDIEIVTERPDLGPEPTAASRTGQKATETSHQATSGSTPSQQQQLPSRSVPTTIRISTDPATQQAAAKPILLPGDKYPAIRTTTSEIFDPDNVPLWNGKPITELDIDADLAENMKPWRRPGADQSDYFNYGFDEFSWAMYCEKQKAMRSGIEEQKNENKLFEQLIGMPPLPTAGASNGGGNSPMPGGAAGGMPGMPGEQEMMQMMMQYMQATGKTDPTQVDFAEMMSQFGMGGPTGVPTGPSGGGQQQGGWGGQQQGGYGGGGGRRGRGRW
ncbi:hypothetical protein, variant [Verruconis gallopava]|uniref:Pre-mRNA polyadenylation factor Fip1 domain-containing protein n=1 Tax=Verruconis gallopava TaxID=253628 RepID=A0A0D2A1E5_9PEZI|nr:uncharacterized protein PV09_08006 [Verruconis gallopava]XP_016210353.1 hypothetical protein, variant [Verruconis gallopava]KIW00483.1 hypothetical protein PV09_08006 [Verruconis gallopava]KIW00484.1 hypothetical protein, variant [Verruconis gallopava]